MSRRGNRNPLIWNYAADYAINPILNEEVTSKVFDWPTQPDGSRMGLYEEKYSGMRAEDIYEDLIKDAQKQQELEKMGEKNNLGEIEDATQTLPAPDFDEDIAQRRFEDEDEDGEEQKTGQGQPGAPKPGTPGKPGGSGDGDPADDSGDDDGDSASNLVGKKVRITEGPDAGRIGTIKQVLPNGDIIIE